MFQSPPASQEALILCSEMYTLPLGYHLSKSSLQKEEGNRYVQIYLYSYIYLAKNKFLWLPPIQTAGNVKYEGKFTFFLFIIVLRDK